MVPPTKDRAASGIRGGAAGARVRKVVAHPQGPSAATKSLFEIVVEGLQVMPRVPRRALAAVVDKICAHGLTVFV